MQTVLVTGTSTGIGEATTAYLAARGWTVYAGVRKAEDGERLKREISGDVRPVILDVSDREQMAQVIAGIESDVGTRGLQGLVNNAGVGTGGPVEYVSEDDWRWVFDINLFSVVALSQAAIPLLRTGGGRIVHIGSIGGRLAAPGLGPYSASKHALEALAETQRQELGRVQPPIRVSLIEPGEVKTAIWDKSDELADEFEAKLDDVGRTRYQWLIDMTRGFISEGRAKGVPPAKVAEAIEHALTADRPKARYLVGPDAKVAGHVVSRLPDRARAAFGEFSTGRWEKHGRKRAGSA
jgi:NAD(P)-dependent dehydrogenase (short-subunit alcohol dehydrogenase family)